MHLETQLRRLRPGQHLSTFGALVLCKRNRHDNVTYALVDYLNRARVYESDVRTMAALMTRVSWKWVA